MQFNIKSFIASDGERFSQIYASEEPGFPLFYPTAYISRSIRLKATHETQKVHLEAIKRLCEWEAKNKIDLIMRFQCREFLRPNEVDDLAQYLRAARRRNSGKTIGASKGNTYISYVATYLTWLADEVITDADNPEISQMITKQESRLQEKLSDKAGSESAKDQQIVKKHLPENARDQLLALWSDPLSKVLRPSDSGSRLRTIVMLRILYETGMRRGELLALKLKHLKEGIGGQVACLVIERNHNDEYDSRVNQPVAKTMGRIVPITPELESQIQQYITDYRADVPNVGFDEEDSIFVTHRRGRGQGEPLSISNFDQAVRGLRKRFPVLLTIYPHLFRHDWNFRFSKLADHEKLNSEKERAIRETLMRWVPESDMARKYNGRHIQEQSLSFGLKVASNTRRSTSVSKEILEEAKKLAIKVVNIG